MWQAARATSAAPLYFEPLIVDDYKLSDGGLLANNPVGWLWTEVLGEFGATCEASCFLSIGTGIDANSPIVQSSLKAPVTTVESFVSCATNSGVTEVQFRVLINAFAPKVPEGKYWRLNVHKEIAAWTEEKQATLFRQDTTVHHEANYEPMVELDDVPDARGRLVELTEEYLNRPEVKVIIRQCAEKLQ